jgi:UDP-2,3-diacylglucosamine hydrolase
MLHKIKDKAIFIADVHFNKNRQDVLELLSKIETGDIFTDQIFFMGDIFDMLIPPVKYTIEINKELIHIINRISNKHEIFFFEGNHDFLLKKIFPNVVVFPLFHQPVLFGINGKTALVLHGDRFAPLSYLVYSAIIRSRAILFFLKIILLDVFSPFFMKYVISRLLTKTICKEQQNFEEYMRSRVEVISKKFSFDYIIEGHFHQGKSYEFGDKKYVNISSFACNKSFFRVEFKNSEIMFSDQHSNSDEMRSING